MKVSVNWLKEYLDFELPAIDELVEKIGAQLGAVEEVIDLGQQYRGIVIAKVVSCQKLEGSDHLNVCLIDDGGSTPDVKRDADGHVQVVCGAPNVREGVIVAWLPPGTVVPSTYGTSDVFTLEARELRGAVSNGMLASAKELAIGDSHEGLLLLEDDALVGADFAQTYKLDDHIIDIENKMFTHRPDCFGQLGVAREVAGILGKPFQSPQWYDASKESQLQNSSSLPFTVKNEIPNLVPRFDAISVADVEVKPSPLWLQTALSRVGMRPINNLVDLTNYYMLLTGQPMHAYDYDKVKALSKEGVQIVVRNPHADEKLELLNGKTIEPRTEAIMIATDQQSIGLGGVMGGANTEVDISTKNIILECASFDMYSIRRTSMAHGIFSDAVTRFNKGQSPLQTLAILSQAVKDLLLLSPGQIASELIDDNHLEASALQRASLFEPVKVTAEFVNERLGVSLKPEEMTTLLTNVECQVAVSGDGLTIIAPFWRTDIELREDVVEEVGRLYGFDKLDFKLPQRDITPVVRDADLELKAAVRASLAKAGANEVLTYSFVHGNLLDRVGQDKALAFEISNALSPDLQYYRLSLTPSLLDKVHANIKAGYNEFALFELGKVHGTSEVDEAGLPKPFGRLSLVYAADAKTAKRRPGAAYYEAKRYLMSLASGWAQLKFVPLETDAFAEYKLFQQMLAPFVAGRSAVIYNGDKIVGVVGEYKPSVTRALKLPEYCAGFEIFLSSLSAKKAQGYTPLSRFPEVEQDICFKVSSDLSYGELAELVGAGLLAAKPDNSLLTIVPLDIFQREDDTAHKQITFRIRIASYDRTLTDKEVSGLLDALAATAKSKYDAERI